MTTYGFHASHEQISPRQLLADVQLADIDHGCYTDLSLTLARHPSETDERMMVRLAALALNAHQVQDVCGGDARIGFAAGLSSPDEPDVQLVDFTGRTRLWIEVGQLDAAFFLAHACPPGLPPSSPR